MPAKPNLFTGDGRNRPVWCSTEIEQTLIADLRAYKNNPRTHSDKSVSRLADAIAEFGFVVPILIDRDNEVITGHGRIEAAKRLKLTAIPTIRADHLTPA